MAPGASARRAGVEVGDRVLEVGGEPEPKLKGRLSLPSGSRPVWSARTPETLPFRSRPKPPKQNAERRGDHEQASDRRHRAEQTK